jgi:Family of unknown function (DUF5309)
MAVPANTVQTFAMNNIREDLSDVISLIDPTEVPFYSMCKKGTAKNRTPEWQNDSLAQPDPTNANIEGDDAVNDTNTQPVRLLNVVQLFDKVVQVSSTAQAVETAGIENPRAYHMMKKGKELKRDMEARFSGNFASVLGAAGTAGLSAGAEAMIKTNVVRGAGGLSGGYNTGTKLFVAATDGTAVTVTEAMLKSVIAQSWTNGAKPTKVMVNGRVKQVMSGFPGIATQYRENVSAEAATIIAAADVYKSDFGLHTIIPNRFMGYGTGRTRNEPSANRTALVLTPDSWSLNFLQPLKKTPLAKTGHSDREMLACEVALECSDEKKNGVIADILIT